MSIESNDQNKFTCVWLADESDQLKLKVKIIEKFATYDQLREYVLDKKKSSVIIIVSKNISLETLLSNELPSICAIYDDKLTRLYCLPELSSVVDDYMINNQKEEEKSAQQSLFRKYWFLIGLICTIILAYLFPNVGKTGGYIRSEWSVKWGCIIFVFFLSGLSLRTKQLLREFLYVRLHIFTQVYSFLIIPFAIYGLGLLLVKLNINKTLVFGIIIMASTSTSISSNVVMTRNALGNEYAALLNAVLGNVLGIFLSPALVFYFMKDSAFDLLSNDGVTDGQLRYTNVIQKLSLTVLVPLILGQIIHNLCPKHVMYVREKLYFGELNSLAILILIWSIFCTAFASRSFEVIPKRDLCILIVINGVIYIIFSLLIMTTARIPIPYWQFSERDTVAMMFCGAMKSLVMGIPLINALYGNSHQEISSVLALPLIVNQVEQLLLGAIEVILLKNWIMNKSREQVTAKEDLKMNELETVNIKSLR
ncbi:unnamed protein product [Adineta ricciae]|uniref:Uncharacterized protein n=1 Tax=Adineta ricciae TaxID=249248 RepID=A0A815HRM0_ADIRI|nr:unnamed protein product [Adineta ricciae]